MYEGVVLCVTSGGVRKEVTEHDTGVPERKLTSDVVLSERSSGRHPGNVYNWGCYRIGRVLNQFDGKSGVDVGPVSWNYGFVVFVLRREMVLFTFCILGPRS